MISPLERKILAVSLDEAVQALEKAGVEVEILRTGPPRDMPARTGTGPGNQRVVRFRLRGNTGIITVTREMRSEK